MAQTSLLRRKTTLNLIVAQYLWKSFLIISTPPCLIIRRIRICINTSALFLMKWRAALLNLKNAVCYLLDLNAKDKCRRFIISNIVGSIGYILAIVVLYLLFSKSTHLWSMTWAFLVDGILLWLVYLLSIGVRSFSKKKRAFHIIARICLFAAVMLLSVALLLLFIAVIKPYLFADYCGYGVYNSLHLLCFFMDCGLGYYSGGTRCRYDNCRRGGAQKRKNQRGGN